MDKELVNEAQKRLAFGFSRFQETAPPSRTTSWEWAVYALGYAHSDWNYAWKCFDQALKEQLPSGAIPLSVPGAALPTAPLLLERPYQALALWRLFESAPSRENGLDLLRHFFPKILKHQQYWYRNRDLEDNGLVCLIHPLEAPLPVQAEDLLEKETFPAAAGFQYNAPAHRAASGGSAVSILTEKDSLFQIQDPYLNALICLSNTALLHMGRYLRIGAPELLELQELTVFSVNEKLWNAEYGAYFAVDLLSGNTIISGSLAGWMPLISAIPDQANAEAMRISFEANFLDDDYRLCPTQPIPANHTDFHAPGKGALHLWENWLLYQGLLQFDFRDLAHKVRKDTLELVGEYGFHLFFHPQRSLVEHLGLDRGNEAAAAAIFLEFLQGAPFQLED
ncbi:MAG: hypothetical protein IPK21_07055 [Haliscomenobacter sp.]|nr:hypothetical protein [Haliscomenobacter sp.]